MHHRLILSASAFLLSACATSDDPAEGGFFSGVGGIAEGTYDARVAEREQDVAEAEARNTALASEQQALAAQIRGAESELSQLKSIIRGQQSALGSLDAATAARVSAILNASPSGATDQAKLAALQKTIADARALSADLANLAG